MSVFSAFGIRLSLFLVGIQDWIFGADIFAEDFEDFRIID
jgi:hypothetical protein